MHILMLSLTVAFALCVLLLLAIGLFTMTPLGRRFGPTRGDAPTNWVRPSRTSRPRY